VGVDPEDNSLPAVQISDTYANELVPKWWVWSVPRDPWLQWRLLKHPYDIALNRTGQLPRFSDSSFADFIHRYRVEGWTSSCTAGWGTQNVPVNTIHSSLIYITLRP